MFLFKVNKNNLNLIREINFKSEKEIQNLTENNLEIIFGIELVKSEFEIKTPQRRYFIDTLAFDPNSNFFVIIEYKGSKNFSVIDQGFAYLAAMLNNKSDLILEYNEKKTANLKRNLIDWSQSKVIFISPEFTPYQESAIQFKDLPIELWEIKKFDNDTIFYNPVMTYEAKESIKVVSKSKIVKKVVNETKTFTIEDHLNKAGSGIKELFGKYQKAVLDLDNRITEKPVSWYIGYKVRYYNFVTLSLSKRSLRIMVRVNKINDSKNLFKRVPESYKWGTTSIWQVQITSDENFDYILGIIRQSYLVAPDR